MGRPRKAIPAEAKRNRKFGKVNPRGGRPAGYRDAMVEQAKALVAQGYSDLEVADFFNVEKTTLWRWKQHVPQFGRAFLRGQDLQVRALEASMFARGTGYSYPSVKIMQHEGRVIRAKFMEHCPPDPKAAQLLLQKLRPKEYSARTIHSGDPTQPVQFIMSNRPPKEEPTDGTADRRPARSPVR